MESPSVMTLMLLTPLGCRCINDNAAWTLASVSNSGFDSQKVLPGMNGCIRSDAMFDSSSMLPSGVQYLTWNWPSLSDSTYNSEWNMKFCESLPLQGTICFLHWVMLFRLPISRALFAIQILIYVRSFAEAMCLSVDNVPIHIDNLNIFLLTFPQANHNYYNLNLANQPE